jgi:hypothetical protein
MASNFVFAGDAPETGIPLVRAPATGAIAEPADPATAIGKFCMSVSLREYSFKARAKIDRHTQNFTIL